MQIIDGKQTALSLETKLRERILAIQNQRSPKLAVVLVGDDAASQSYVGGKEKACARIGILSKIIRLPQETLTEEVLSIVVELNHADDVDGILVQLPMPKHIDAEKVVQAIDPSKDVDGLHPINVAKLYAKQKGFVPCTPKGIMTLLSEYHIDVSGLNVVVIGRSALVGRPIAQLLLNQNATVTVCHSKTKDLEKHTQAADLIVVAMGQPKFLGRHHISGHPIIIDVGINRVDGKLVGDTDYEAIAELCSYITPVPGGVGPMTIATLLENTLEAYDQHLKETVCTSTI